jgi:hypothetical protein
MRFRFHTPRFLLISFAIAMATAPPARSQTAWTQPEFIVATFSDPQTIANDPAESIRNSNSRVPPGSIASPGPAAHVPGKLDESGLLNRSGLRETALMRRLPPGCTPSSPTGTGLGAAGSTNPPTVQQMNDAGIAQHAGWLPVADRRNSRRCSATGCGMSQAATPVRYRSCPVPA